ncbi:MAG: FAD binding domain-containing protein [Fusobacterium perfoetens]|uniref:FAD binding domain-containing protein n=1 Tax=Fusobacterium perfoetens TaxID=852 RepID=UPI0023F14DF0|nr:FAD binding domain-containing protein [Fusobacterium perfoetens]MCI6152611.1 FAD binding domain-containing protein [Fusobacterium perfoetens]MDY3237618.1 FAD binding domain-containing protein [Fusobacterium perfoetens]
MLTIKEYVSVESLEEAYKLNQNVNNVILGGTGWLKLQNRNIVKAIDLSKLGLDKIEEDEEKYTIGCMVTLRDIEKNVSLNEYTNNALKNSLKDIVGVQFRNCVTIGGSIYSRFGFSDILTSLLTLDTYVEMYKGGIIPLKDFVNMPYDKDILVRIIIKKDGRKVGYSAFRNQSTDFPVITCGVTITENKKVYAVIGARPYKAKVVEDNENILGEFSEENIEKFAKYVSENLKFDSNMRASGEYRKRLTEVFVKRTLKKLMEEK